MLGRKLHNWRRIVVLALTGLGGILLLLGCGRGGSDRAVKMSAVSAAERFVMKQLPAGRRARIVEGDRSIDERATALPVTKEQAAAGERGYQVVGQFDSFDRPGKAVRYDFICLLRYRGKEWRLEELSTRLAE